MINDVKMLKIYATPCGKDPILYSRVNNFMTCKNLTSKSERITTRILVFIGGNKPSIM